MTDFIEQTRATSERMLSSGEHVAEIAWHYFRFDLRDQGTKLLWIQLSTVLDVLMTDRERLVRFMGDHSPDEAEEQIRAWLDAHRSTDAAMQAQALIQRTRSKRRLAEILVNVAGWSALECSYFSAWREGKLAETTDIALTAVELFGSLCEMDRQYSAKAEGGAKGAQTRSSTMEERRANALRMYDELGLETLSAIAAAERLRREGATVSIDKLARDISKLRKERAVGTKTRAEHTKGRAPDPKGTSTD